MALFSGGFFRLKVILFTKSCKRQQFESASVVLTLRVRIAVCIIVAVLTGRVRTILNLGPLLNVVLTLKWDHSSRGA